VEVTTIIDAAHNPEAQMELLSGSLNITQCPNCGQPSTTAAPLLYHDAEKELLITLVPMALGMSEDHSEKFIGALMNELTANMDQKLVKGYIFQPRRALTMQGLVEQVLEAEGITKEMQEAQRERARLVQMFLQTDPEQLEGIVREHDDKIDEELFSAFSFMAEQTAQQGRPDMAEYILGVQQQVAAYSTAGKTLLERAERQQAVLEEIATKLRSLGERPTPSDVVELVRPYAENDDALQAFVGLARVLFDYNFFEELTKHIDKAPADEKAKLQDMRETLVELTQVIDQQQHSAMQAAADLLRTILNHANPEEAIRANMGHIDETFMGILELNINEAEKQGDITAASRLKGVRDMVMEVLQANMRPDVRFINDLLSTETETAALEKIKTGAAGFGPDLLQTFDALIEIIEAQGQPQIVARLQNLRSATEETLNAGNA